MNPRDASASKKCQTLFLSESSPYLIFVNFDDPVENENLGAQVVASQSLGRVARGSSALRGVIGILRLS